MSEITKQVDDKLAQGIIDGTAISKEMRLRMKEEVESMDPKPVLMNHNSNSLPPATIHVDLDGASAIYAIHGWYFPHERDTLFESGLLNTLEIPPTRDIVPLN